MREGRLAVVRVNSRLSSNPLQVFASKKAAPLRRAALSYGFSDLLTIHPLASSTRAYRKLTP